MNCHLTTTKLKSSKLKCKNISFTKYVFHYVFDLIPILVIVGIVLTDKN